MPMFNKKAFTAFNIDHLIKAFAFEILIKVINGSKGEYIRQYRYQSESGTCYKHKLHPRILKKENAVGNQTI